MQVNFNDYYITNGKELDDKGLDIIAELTLETGDYEITSRDNLLGLSAKQLQKQLTVLPAQQYLRVIQDKSQIVGFHLSLTQQENVTAFTSKRQYLRASTELDFVAKEINALYDKHSKDNDLLVHYCCISKDYRGKNLYSALFNDQLQIAKEKNCNRMFLLTWEKNTHALDVFIHYGAIINQALDFTGTEYNDRLLNLTISI